VTRRVAVIGGGIGGASAALRLAQTGVDVTLIERSPSLGGLVVSFEVAGTPLECFYHHIFPHEREIIGLIDELGLSGRLGWYPSSVGILRDGRFWPFTSPLDLLRFGPLSLVDRLRTGIGGLRLCRVGDWQELDQLPAQDWLRAYCGGPAVDVVWGPMLTAKFGPAAGDVPAAWMWGRFQQRAGARKGGGEKLGYLRGGFRQLFEALDRTLRRAGVQVATETAVSEIILNGDRVTGVETNAGTVDADAVLYTGPLPGLSRLVPEDRTDPRWGQVGGLGVICVILELARPISNVYWTNVCDPALPFGGIIEHTNFVPSADYGGRHIAYLSRYFTSDEPIAGSDPTEEAVRWVDALVDRVDGLRRQDVLAVHPFKTPYGAPLVSVGHLDRIPPLQSHLDGLWVSTTGQIYPQDRGMSEGVRTGTEAAAAIVAAGRTSVGGPR
jgi:protoporphyrinogen oxidase